MKIRMRLKLDAKEPKASLRGRNLKHVIKVNIEQAAKRRELMRKSIPLTWINDHQTPEERRLREIQAQEEAEKSKAALLLKRLSFASATGERCKAKACPFPAVLDGECRRHVLDRAQISSL